MGVIGCQLKAEEILRHTISSELGVEMTKGSL